MSQFLPCQDIRWANEVEMNFLRQSFFENSGQNLDPDGPESYFLEVDIEYG